MMKDCFIYLFSLLALLSISTKSIAQNDSSYLFEKFSKKSLKKDIEFAINKIEEIHPEPYHYISKELILKEKNRILGSLDDSVSRLDFLRKFSPLLNIYNNGHIQLHGFIYDNFLSYSLTHGGRLFPFLVSYYKGKLYVNNVLKDSCEIKPLDEIIEVNGLTVEKIFSDCYKHYNRESNKAKNWLIEKDFYKFLNYLYGWNNEFTLKYKSPKYNEVKTTKLRGIDLEEIAKLNQNFNPKFVRYTDSMLFRLDYVFYAYMLKEKDIAYLDFRSFQLNLDKAEEQKVKQKIDSLFAYLKQNNIKNLIIDIRKNGGGEDCCTEVLMGNLTNTAWSWGKARMKFSKEQKEMYKKIFIDDAESPEDSIKNYKKYIEPENGTIKDLEVEIPEISAKKYEGNVYLLTGSFTYSAAMSFASVCKCHGVATLIGGETGGASHNFTSSLSFELPKTKAGFSVPHRDVESPCEADYYRGVIPDYEVIPTPKSKIEGRDMVLEYAIEMAKKGSKE